MRQFVFHRKTVFSVILLFCFISNCPAQTSKLLKQNLEKAERCFLKGAYYDSEKYCLKALDKDEKDWRSELVLYLIDCQLNRSKLEHLKLYLEKNYRLEDYLFAGSVYSYKDVMNGYADECYSSIKRKSSPAAVKKIYCRQLEEAASIALKHQPNNEKLLKITAFSCCLAGEYSKAEKYAELLTRESKEQGCFAYGYIYGREGRTALAKELYQEVLRLNPNNSSALWNLANLYYDSRAGIPSNSRNNKDFQMSLDLRALAAKSGLELAMDWCRKNHIDWSFSSLNTAMPDISLEMEPSFTDFTVSSKTTSNNSNKQNVLPTPEEINATNARLPVFVSEGTIWTKVEYDQGSMTQRFFYRFTDEVDRRKIETAKRKGKEQMINALKQNPKSMDRINAGMTYIYLYYANNKTLLYEIKINKSDFK